MAERRPARLDQPRENIRRFAWPAWMTNEAFGVLSEKFARFMGTAQFLIGMTVFVTLWLGWNTYTPERLQFDPRSLNYTLLTLILSLQASYAAPLILLAQNRQADRDKVALEQDRVQAERNLADTEFLTREVAALRLALRETATRDFVRSELKDLLEEFERRGLFPEEPSINAGPKKKGKGKPAASGEPAAYRQPSDTAAPGRPT